MRRRCVFHQLYWSRGVSGKEDLTQELIPTDVTPHVPIMADQASAIIVETWVDYTPIMDIPIMPIGLRETEIYNIVVTAPRFTDQLKFEGMGDGTGSTHDDAVTDESGSIGHARVGFRFTFAKSRPMPALPCFSAV